MRSYVAYFCVRYVGHMMAKSYGHYCIEHRRRALLYARLSRHAQRLLLPIARCADKEMTTTQMIDEGWWG